MANQNNMKKTKINSASSYKHQNLMMFSVMVGMCALLVLMLLSTYFKTVSSVDTAFFASKLVSALFFIAFIVLGILSFKKDMDLLEYCIYSLVMSIGFLSLCGTPFFLPNAKWINTIFTTRYVQVGMTAINIAYIIFALIYHGIKTEKK